MKAARALAALGVAALQCVAGRRHDRTPGAAAAAVDQVGPASSLAFAAHDAVLHQADSSGAARAAGATPRAGSGICNLN